MADLVTLTEVASFLKRDLDAYDAATAAQLVTATSDLVIEYCGWHITPSITETVTIDGSGNRVLALPTLYLTNLASVTEAGLALDVTTLDWSAHGIVVKRNGAAWTTRRRGVAAEMTHGLAAAPAWLKTLVCAVVGRALLTPVGVEREVAGGEQVMYARDAPAGTVVLLDVEQRMLDRLAIPAAA